MLQFAKRINAARRREEGASAVEYGLLVALIAAVIVLVVLALGTVLKEAFKDTCDAIEGNGSIAANSCGAAATP